MSAIPFAANTLLVFIRLLADQTEPLCTYNLSDLITIKHLTFIRLRSCIKSADNVINQWFVTLHTFKPIASC